MTPVEIIALITAGIIIIKSILLIFKPKFFISLAEKVFKRSSILVVIYFILALIVGYFALQELTVAQVAAVLLLSSLLIKMILASYSKGLSTMVKETMQKKTNWFAIAVMLITAVAILVSVLTI